MSATVHRAPIMAPMPIATGSTKNSSHTTTVAPRHTSPTEIPMYGNKPPMTKGAEAILRARQMPRQPPMQQPMPPPMGSMRPGPPATPPIQAPPMAPPMGEMDPNAQKHPMGFDPNGRLPQGGPRLPPQTGGVRAQQPTRMPPRVGWPQKQ